MATAHIEIVITDQGGETARSQQLITLPDDLLEEQYSSLAIKMKNAAAEAAGVEIPAFKPF